MRSGKKNVLSKSTFIRGLQCHKSLYLYKNRYFLRDKLSPEQLAKFRRGTDVGVLARDLFPGGFDASPPTHFQTGRAVETTRELVEKRQPVIYEAYFSHNSVIVALDILEHKDGKWFGYEVKSSLAISEAYLNDAALQYHVISKCGIEPEDFSIIYMNKDYVLQGDLDLSQLFITQSVLEEARSRQPMIAEEIEAQLTVVVLPKSPAIDIGPHCNKPYPCDFQGHCWKHIPKNSIFDLQWLSEEQKFELYSKKILQVEDIPDDFLSDLVQRMKLQANKTATPFIDKEPIRSFIENLEYPLCFFKAWYYRPAVPLYQGTGPYERLPFFMSAGIATSELSEPEIKHLNFDPARHPLSDFHELVKEMLSISQTLVVYDDPNVADLFSQEVPASAEKTNAQFFDLCKIPVDNHYFHPATNGSSDLTIFASKLLNLKIPTDLYYSEIEAATGFLQASGNNAEFDEFIEKMGNTSKFHLECMMEFFSLMRKFS